MTNRPASGFARRQIAQSLLAQAHLCERIAAACWDEDTAAKFRTTARECGDAAAE